MRRGGGWPIVLFIAAIVFFGLALMVALSGVPATERTVYETIQRASSPTIVSAFRQVTRLGSESLLFPAGIVLLAALPGRLLRHWWLWVTAILLASAAEGVAKILVGRPRPTALHPGFPSGHTAAATAFFVMLAYFAWTTITSTVTRYAIWLIAIMTILAVAISRVVLTAHWPLDTVGGAALGLICVAAVVWWHQNHPPVPGRSSRPMSFAFQNWLDGWKDRLPIPLCAVLFLTPPFVAEESLLDVLFDAGGVTLICLGLLLRAWAVGNTERLFHPTEAPDADLVTRGPYAYLRHPMYLGNFVIGLGVGVLAENAIALAVVPTVFSLAYGRVIVPGEETHLRDRFGAKYDDYCERVPAWLPRLRRCGEPGFSLSWRTLRHEAPAALAAALMAIVAEVSEFLPHLFR
jgi:protein-S-isoprenylcysteine O-methyltransferase Ste14/membrane-associated phospholipid phosphatase